jgi:hypothetical protein
MTDSTDNAQGPERIWALHNYVAGVTNILSGHIMLEPTGIAQTTEYRRADLTPAPTGGPHMTRRDDLIALLREARADLATYVDADYPPETRKQYPDIQRRWDRDMELCRRIDAIIEQEDRT